MTGSHHLRPQSSLFRQGLIAAAVFTTPVFVVLYVLTVPDGAWRLVVFVHISAAIAIAIASTLYFRTGVWVDASGIRERGFFGRMTTVALDDIGSTIMAETFTGVGAETSPQLFICDHDGKQLIRMRGQFWSRENMQVVVLTLDVPHRVLDDVFSPKELHSEFPGLLYWFERRPVIAALAFTAVTAVFGALILVAMRLLGITPR